MLQCSPRQFFFATIPPLPVLSQALAAADLLLVLSQGRVVYQGPPRGAPPSLGLDIAASPPKAEGPYGGSRDEDIGQGDCPGLYSDTAASSGSAAGSPEKNTPGVPVGEGSPYQLGGRREGTGKEERRGDGEGEAEARATGAVKLSSYM